MATRLPGDAEHHYRTTDHGPEIARLRERAKKKEHYDSLVYLVAADCWRGTTRQG